MVGGLDRPTAEAILGAVELEAPDAATGLTFVGEGCQGSVCRRNLLGGLVHEHRRAA
jgi:hypothetical protein